MKQERPYPKLIVSRKAARGLRSGHPWVFAGEILHADDSQNGSIVDVFEENGTWQGAALLSQQSTIRARIVSRNANDRFDAARPKATDKVPTASARCLPCRLG